MSINWDNAYAAKDSAHERELILEEAREALRNERSDEIRNLFRDAASGTPDVYVPYIKYVGGRSTLDYMSVWEAVSDYLAAKDVWTAFEQMAVSNSEANRSAFWEEIATAYLADILDDLVEYDMEHDDDDYYE